MKKQFLILVLMLIGAVAAWFLFKQGNIQQRAVEKNVGVTKITVNNQGGVMEGHTPRGFKGMGTGLFVGDNLNPNFPNGDGVQIFLTFDLSRVQGNITSAFLKSKSGHVQGSPFKDLGPLKVEIVSYDEFSSASWSLEPDNQACTVSDMHEGRFECDVTTALQQIPADKSRYAQFRIRFEKVSDNDGKPDLALFYNTDSNTNEPGIFQLEIATATKKEVTQSGVIHVPLALHLVKNSGAISTQRSQDSVWQLFQKSQEIWDQANIVFDASVGEIMLDDDIKESLLKGNFKEIYRVLPADDRAIHVFFINTLHGPNGIALVPSLALIADHTTVNDFRATAHELGHLLGLDHVNIDSNRLMFRGVNGTGLTAEEIAMIRAAAQQRQELKSSEEI